VRASLRRIATLVAKDAAPAEIFAAVAPKSINVFFRLDPATRDIAGVVRFEPGPELVVVGVSKTIEAVCRSRCPARPASSEVTPHLEVALLRGGVVAVGRAAGLPQPRHRLSHGLHAVVPLLVRLGVRLGGEALPHVVQRAHLLLEVVGEPLQRPLGPLDVADDGVELLEVDRRTGESIGMLAPRVTLGGGWPTNVRCQSSTAH